MINLREKNIEKLILIAKPEKAFEECFSLYLEKVYCLDFSKDYDIDELARRIYKEPKYIKSDLGKRKEYKPIVLSSKLELNNLEYTYDKEEFKYYLIESEKNNTDAQYNLGVMYANGEGIEQNYEKAIEWYTKAADQGDAGAQLNLGLMYANGQYVSQDYKKAYEWFTKAAEQGEVRAQYSLGLMYHKGEGVEQNYEKAIYWYTKAAEQGYGDAIEALERLK